MAYRGWKKKEKKWELPKEVRTSRKGEANPLRQRRVPKWPAVVPSDRASVCEWSVCSMKTTFLSWLWPKAPTHQTGRLFCKTNHRSANGSNLFLSTLFSFFCLFFWAYCAFFYMLWFLKAMEKRISRPVLPIWCRRGINFFFTYKSYSSFLS